MHRALGQDALQDYLRTCTIMAEMRHNEKLKSISSNMGHVSQVVGSGCCGLSAFRKLP